jgi:AAA15 family ATPase/GTPase
MLVEFRVKNFRSLRDEQVLSLVAAKDKSLQDSNTVATGIGAAPVLLRSAVIYGANASGKSNLIKALQYMRGVVAESASFQPGQTFSAQAFRLDASSGTQPIEFEITFILDKVRYQYGFSLTAQRIVSEHLLVYKTAKPQCWFERYYDADSDKEHYKFSAGLKGQKSMWQAGTLSNSLFLSRAVQLNSAQLRPVFNWFIDQLVILNELAPLSPQFSVQMLRQQNSKEAICKFLNSADINISDIDVQTRTVPTQAMHFDFVAGKTETRNEAMEINELRFHHTTSQGEAIFDMADESSGTRNLLFLAGPVLDILNTGRTLVIDELDTSLHTLLVRRLVQLFHNRELNTQGAQLIFTTHDTSLLDAADLFRRDQIWFIEKNHEQASTLYGLSDFSPRKNEALERGYLAGRYGGLPFLGDWGRNS